ncbi:hypothetical protein [Olivibacter jilunii]|uniref:hypothetical protein n=1 Tax=Olivibacter jilunii TaxID=985016 RepID=UPI0010315B5A|nr:hypothetical protein [Olivibacter jilunii]
MTRKTFNNEGVQLLLADIYRLPVADYQRELYDIQSDFRTWLLVHFDFTPRQEAYVNELDADYLYLLSQEVSKAIENQCPIMLQKQEPADDDDGEGKVIETNYVRQSAFKLDDGLRSVSSLIINIRYERD